MIDVHRITVGPFAEQCYVARVDSGSARAVVVDPGAEAERILELVAGLGATVEAILVTHGHVDHVAAVAPLARATGARVHCSGFVAEILGALPDIMAHDRMPARLGPFEACDADVVLAGGERLALAGLAVDVLAAPGHSPGHLVYAIPSAGLAFSGDVLFAGRIGDTAAPLADPVALRATLRRLLRTLPPETTLHPGHGDSTTLARELRENPELAAIAETARPPA